MKCKEFERKQRKKRILEHELYRCQEHNEGKIRDRLRNDVLRLLNKSPRTIPELSNELMADEFDVVSAIGDLESMNKVQLDSWKTLYSTDGNVGYIAVYGCMRTPMTRQ